MIKIITCLLLFLCLSLSQRAPDEFTINLDLKPSQRYVALAKAKSSLINKFIDYLYTVQKYKIAFRTSKRFSLILKHMVGSQFYEECKGIASSIGRKVSEIVVFNYMYQLGAYTDFCTSIPVQISQNDYFLMRNLDYGYQQFLANNSVKLTYEKGGIPIYQTIGHAGLIGAHSALRFDGYSVTLNERVDAGLHRTLQEIFSHRSQTVPYLVQKTLRNCPTIEEAQKSLATTRVASAVYYILNSQNRNIVIQKSRIGAKAVYENKKFIVQTNTDHQIPDPDTRRDVAQSKVQKLWDSNLINRQNIWKVLTQKPNMNNLTLITILLDTSRNLVNATVWV